MCEGIGSGVQMDSKWVEHFFVAGASSEVNVAIGFGTTNCDCGHESGKYRKKSLQFAKTILN
jgi:hypothetical protein